MKHKMAKTRRFNPKKSFYQTFWGKVLYVGCFSVAGVFATTTIASAWSISGALTYIQQKLLTQRVNDAVKVYTAQDMLSNNMLGEAIVMAKQKLATAEKQVQTKENIMDTYNNFINQHSMTSESRCTALATRRNDTIAAQKADLFAISDLGNTINATTSNYESDRQLSINSAQLQVACTFEQAKAGFCKPIATGAQYFDVDLGLLDSSARIGENEFTAAKLGILSIANPTKDKNIIADCGADTACSVKKAKSDSRIAVNSLVANALLRKAYSRVAVGSSYE